MSSRRPTSPYSQEPRRHFFGHTRPIEVLEGSDDGLGGLSMAMEDGFSVAGWIDPFAGLG